jgi:crossover junction endodeoxyribonuclease RusA
MDDLKRTEVKRKTRALKMTLPVPPSVNSIYYNTRGGGRRLKASAERYIRDTRALTHMFVEDQGWEKKTDATWIYIDMVFYFPDKRIRDSHNCLKILLDAIEGIVFQNDYYIMPRIHSVEYDKQNPRVEMKIVDQTKAERLRNIEKVLQ